jgi:peptidoglycan hydrolase-like protein with peptidoglycan-binding domain
MQKEQMKSGYTARVLMQILALCFLVASLGGCGKTNLSHVEQALTCDDSHAFNGNRKKIWDATVTAVTRLNGISLLDKSSGIISSKKGSVDGEELSMFDTAFLGHTYKYSYEIVLSEVSSTRTRVMVDVKLFSNQFRVIVNREQKIDSVESYLIKKLYKSICKNISASGERACVNTLPCRRTRSSVKPAAYSSPPPTVMDIQQELSNKGYKPGPVDGIMGRKTHSALKSFQRDNGLVTTGNIDQETTDRLLNGSANSVASRSTHQVTSEPKAKQKPKSKSKPNPAPESVLERTSSPVIAPEKSKQYIVVEDMSLQGDMNPFSTIILELSRGDRVTLVASEGEWSEVKVQGKTGYVYSDSIEKTSVNAASFPKAKKITPPVTSAPEVKTPSAPEKQAEPDTVSVPLQIEKVEVKRAIVNEETSIMTKPSSFSTIVVDISPGLELKVIGKERDFYEVQHKDKKGYVYEEFVDIVK